MIIADGDGGGAAMRAIITALALGTLLTGCAVEPAPEEVREGPGPLSVIAMSGGLEGDDAASVIAGTRRRRPSRRECAGPWCG